MLVRLALSSQTAPAVDELHLLLVGEAVLHLLYLCQDVRVPPHGGPLAQR